MHSPYLKLFSVIVLIVAACALVGVMTRGHWWKRLGDAHVVYDGQRLANANVYRSPNAELLVDLNEVSDEGGLYVIYPAEKKVGLPNERHFVLLPGYAYSRYVSPIVVFMNSVKADTDPKVAISADAVEFSTLRDRRVQIILQ